MNVQKAIFYLSNIFNFIQNYYHYFVNIIFWLIIFIVVYLIIWVISLIVNTLRLLPRLRFVNKLSSNSYYNSPYASSNNNFQNKISAPRGFFFTSLLILIFFILLLMSLFFIKKFNFTPLSKIISLPNFSTEKLHQLTALPNNYSDNNVFFRQKLVKDLEELDLILKMKDYQPVSLESEQQKLLKEVNVLKFKIINDSNVSEKQITENIDSLKHKIDELNYKYNEIINKSINYNNFKKSLGIPIFVPVIRSINC
ncbi:hypothetical protein OC683_00500 ['Crotalaria aegyptiaca' phytoplasma]|uniref:Uncharacterized protein n=1 Tax=Candidatus Phytoplasma crotalariae TaxID=2982627 RepID=A0ABT9D3E2_9MOLU|nr:hypothetical protein ['Crotalaria aegyptiaca' phytoplasma]MDO8059100.1 hypothetical protein ['Crotalaria aegyptiaca' phytoplasma]